MTSHGLQQAAWGAEASWGQLHSAVAMEVPLLVVAKEGASSVVEEGVVAIVHCASHDHLGAGTVVVGEVACSNATAAPHHDSLPQAGPPGALAVDRLAQAACSQLSSRHAAIHAPLDHVS